MTDKQFLDSCLERRDRIHAELAEVTEEKKKVMAHEDRLVKALAGIDMVILDAQARTGSSATATAAANSKEDHNEQAEAQGGAADFSPTWFVREFILAHASNGGALPAAIKRKAGTPYDKSPSFPYTVLNRLMSRGELRRQNGRYYPTDKMPKQRTEDDFGGLIE